MDVSAEGVNGNLQQSGSNNTYQHVKNRQSDRHRKITEKEKVQKKTVFVSITNSPSGFILMEDLEREINLKCRGADLHEVRQLLFRMKKNGEIFVTKSKYAYIRKFKSPGAMEVELKKAIAKTKGDASDVKFIEECNKGTKKRAIHRILKRCFPEGAKAKTIVKRSSDYIFISKASIPSILSAGARVGTLSSTIKNGSTIYKYIKDPDEKTASSLMSAPRKPTKPNAEHLKLLWVKYKEEKFSNKDVDEHLVIHTNATKHTGRNLIYRAMQFGLLEKAPTTGKISLYHFTPKYIAEITALPPVKKEEATPSSSTDTSSPIDMSSTIMEKALAIAVKDNERLEKEVSILKQKLEDISKLAQP